MKIGGMLCTAQYYKQPPSNTYKIILSISLSYQFSFTRNVSPLLLSCPSNPKGNKGNVPLF